jgi:hypothetical protein
MQKNAWKMPSREDKSRRGPEFDPPMALFFFLTLQETNRCWKKIAMGDRTLYQRVPIKKSDRIARQQKKIERRGQRKSWQLFVYFQVCLNSNFENIGILAFTQLDKK